VTAQPQSTARTIPAVSTVQFIQPQASNPPR
jgi:hypothetical protein